MMVNLTKRCHSAKDSFYNIIIPLVKFGMFIMFNCYSHMAYISSSKIPLSASVVAASVVAVSVVVAASSNCDVEQERDVTELCRDSLVVDGNEVKLTSCLVSSR